LLLRPLPGTPSAQYGGAYVAFAVIAKDIGEALEHLVGALTKEDWQVTSIETMKRAWDYHDDDDEDEIVEQRPSWLDLIEGAERAGLSLGSIHTFRTDRRIT
jgi:hypothetical protein